MHIITVTNLLPVSAKLLNFCSETPYSAGIILPSKFAFTLLDISADKVYARQMVPSLFPWAYITSDITWQPMQALHKRLIVWGYHYKSISLIKPDKIISIWIQDICRNVKRLSQLIL